MARQIKVELPADPTAQYEPPAEATLEDLAGLAESAREQGRALLDAAKTAEEVAQATRFIDAAKSINARSAQVQADAQAHADAVAAARAELDATGQQEEAAETEPSAAEAATATTGDGDDAETEEQRRARLAAEQQRNEPVAAQTGDVSDPAAVGAEPALVASSTSDGNGRTVIRPAGQMPGRRSAVAAAASVGPAPTLPALTRDRGAAATLTAAAGVPNFTPQQELTWDDLGVVAEGRFNALPKHRPGTRAPQQGSVETKIPIASIDMPTHDKALVASAKGNAEFAECDEAIEWAVSNHRLQQETGEESLTAAGGWCAPSETLYDLLDITTEDGLLDVPGITVTRGGVRYALGPDFTQVYVTGNANFTRTEAQAIAGTPTKPMVNIPCPAFTDNRMVVDGLYLTGDILTSKGYPEAYADYTRKAMKAFAHYVNAASITDQVNLSTLVDLSVSTGTLPITNRSASATVEVLGAIELQVTDMKYKNRLSMTQPVEVVAPYWLRGNIRSDLAKRMGWTNPFSVSDQDIRDWFGERGATVQFVYDWQDAFTGVAGGFGSSTAIAGWPNTANILLYPAGTFVRALEPVIELSAVYDSTLLQTNQYVALFTEQGRLTLKRHWDARNLKIDVRPLGNTVSGSPVGPAQNLQGSVL